MYFYFICMGILRHVCLCTIYVPGAHRSQQRRLGTLELELQTIESHHVGAGNQIQVLWKSSLFTSEPSLQPLELFLNFNFRFFIDVL